jgi:hypothetical protein
LRPARRRGAREQKVVELNSKLPVRDERNKSRKSRSKRLPLISVSPTSGKFCESTALTKLPKPCAIDLPMPFDGSAAKRL